MKKLDIAIIGSGPNGISAYATIKENYPMYSIGCFEKGRSLMNLENIPEVRWHSRMNELTLGLSVDKYIDPQYIPKTSELISYYRKYILEKQIIINEGHELIQLNYLESEGCYNLYFSNGTSVKSTYILLSTGIFTNKKKLKINSDLVNYNFNFYSGQKICLVGAGNSAVDFIIYNLKTNRITWLLRGTDINPMDPVTKKSFNNIVDSYGHNLTIVHNSQIISIKDSVVDYGNTREHFDNVTALIGFDSKCDLFKKIGLVYEEDCLKLDNDFQTSLRNVYAIGSISARWNKKLEKSEPTFIHNGNPNVLSKVVESINKKMLKEISIAFVEDIHEKRNKNPIFKLLWKKLGI